MDKSLRNALIVGILLVGGSAFYYLVIYIPLRDQAKMDFVVEKEKKLSDCLTEARRPYKEFQNSIMSRSTEDLNNDSQETKSLRLSKIKALDSIRKEGETECFKKYPQ